MDNIPKRILDSLKGIIFDDDFAVSHSLAARIDATLDNEIPSEGISAEDHGMLSTLLGDPNKPDILYVEIGPRTKPAVAFGEVI